MKPIVFLCLFSCLFLFSCEKDYVCNCDVTVEDGGAPLSFENNELYESTRKGKAQDACTEHQAYLSKTFYGGQVQCRVTEL